MSDLQHDLAALVHRFRRLTVPGATDWDVAGIRHFLAQCEGASPCEVASAAFALAARPDVKTPAMLPQPGSHWPKGDGMSGPRVRLTQRCPEHPEYDMPHDHSDPSWTAEDAAEQARQARLALRPTRVPRPGPQETR